MRHERGRNSLALLSSSAQAGTMHVSILSLQDNYAIICHTMAVMQNTGPEVL